MESSKNNLQVTEFLSDWSTRYFCHPLGKCHSFGHAHDFKVPGILSHPDFSADKGAWSIKSTLGRDLFHCTKSLKSRHKPTGTLMLSRFFSEDRMVIFLKVSFVCCNKQDRHQ